MPALLHSVLFYKQKAGKYRHSFLKSAERAPVDSQLLYSRARCGRKSLNRLRSSSLEILPVAVWGISSTSTQSSGNHHFAILPCTEHTWDATRVHASSLGLQPALVKRAQCFTQHKGMVSSKESLCLFMTCQRQCTVPTGRPRNKLPMRMAGEDAWCHVRNVNDTFPFTRQAVVNTDAGSLGCAWPCKMHQIWKGTHLHEGEHVLRRRRRPGRVRHHDQQRPFIPLWVRDGNNRRLQHLCAMPAVNRAVQCV